MARPSGLLGLSPSLPDAPVDVRAQLAALHDVTAGKNTAFFPPGTRVPKRLPPGVHAVARREGRLATTDPKKATLFARTPQLDDAKLARLLGYAEDKLSAFAAGRAAVVQGLAHGGVAHSQLASPSGIPRAIEAARRAVPGAAVRVVSPLAALTRQAGLLGKPR